MNSLFKTVTTNQSKEVVMNIPANLNVDYQSIHIENLKLNMSIGILESEKIEPQTVLVNAEIFVTPSKDWGNDTVETIVSYADIIDIIEKIASQGHIDLVETFAHKIIEECFAHSHKILSADIKIDKIDIISQTKSVGCRIKKSKI